MSREPDYGAIRSVSDLLAIGRLMEERSAERYAELADSFETSCNLDAAEAFRELADGEVRHAADFPALGENAPKVMPWGEEDPEIADPDAVHYLMRPWHVFDLALRHEKTAQDFFTQLAARTTIAEVKAEAERLAAREAQHVAHMEKRRDAEPLPPDDWDEDEDGPNWDASD